MPKKLKPLSKIKGYRKLDKNFRVKRVFPLLKNAEVPTLLAIPYAFGYVNRFRAYEIARVKRFPAPQLLKTKSSKKLYVEVPERSNGLD